MLLLHAWASLGLSRSNMTRPIFSRRYLRSKLLEAQRGMIKSKVVLQAWAGFEVKQKQ